MYHGNCLIAVLRHVWTTPGACSISMILAFRGSHRGPWPHFAVIDNQGYLWCAVPTSDTELPWWRQLWFGYEWKIHRRYTAVDTDS